MKTQLLVLILSVMISCQKKDWKTNLLREISKFEKTEKIEKQYSLKHNSGNEILIKLFKTHSNGLTKFTAEYKRPNIGSWNKLFYIKNEKILFSRNFGISTVSKLENDSLYRPKYFLMERIVWFENDSIGKEEIKELELNELTDIESKKAELLNMEFIISDLNINDYKLFENDYKALSE